MHPVYSDNCFTRPVIHVWCKKFAQSRESFVEKQRPATVVLMTDAMIVAAKTVLCAAVYTFALIDGINA